MDLNGTKWTCEEGPFGSICTLSELQIHKGPPADLPVLQNELFTPHPVSQQRAYLTRVSRACLPSNDIARSSSYFFKQGGLCDPNK